MKIRNGFVSNSSSSSFIIGLKNIPTSQDELKKLLLGDDFDYPVLTHYDTSFSTDLIINRIYTDLINKINNNEYDTDYHNSNIFTTIGDRLSYDADYYSKYISQNNRNRFSELLKLLKELHGRISYKLSERDTPIQKELKNNYNLYTKELTNIILDGISQNKKDSNYFIEIEYSDNDGEIDSYIEHGGILDPITFLYFNNH